MAAFLALGWAATSSPALIAAFKWLASGDDVQAPFLALGVTHVGLLAIALVGFASRVIMGNGVERAFPLKASHYMVLQFLYCAYHCLNVLVIFRASMTTAMYLVLMQADYVFVIVLAPLLKRRLHWTAFAAAFCAALSIVVFTCVSIDPLGADSVLGSLHWTPPNDQERGTILVCLMARLLYVLRGVVSKLVLLMAVWDASDSPPGEPEQYRHLFAHFSMDDNPNSVHALGSTEDRELELLRADQLFNYMVLDGDLFGSSVRMTYELHGVGGALALVPVTFWLAFADDETAGQFAALDPDLYSSTTCWLMLGLVVAVMARPLFLHLFMANVHDATFTTCRSILVVLVTLGAMLYHDDGSTSFAPAGRFLLSPLLAVALLAATHRLMHVSATTLRNARLRNALLAHCRQLLREEGCNPRTQKQFNKLMRSINASLGEQAFYDALVRTSVGGQFRPTDCLTASFVDLRGHFDDQYTHPAGGYCAVPKRRHIEETITAFSPPKYHKELPAASLEQARRRSSLGGDTNPMVTAAAAAAAKNGPGPTAAASKKAKASASLARRSSGLSLSRRGRHSPQEEVIGRLDDEVEKPPPFVVNPPSMRVVDPPSASDDEDDVSVNVEASSTVRPESIGIAGGLSGRASGRSGTGSEKEDHKEAPAPTPAPAPAAAPTPAPAPAKQEQETEKDDGGSRAAEAPAPVRSMPAATATASAGVRRLPPLSRRRRARNKALDDDDDDED